MVKLHSFKLLEPTMRSFVSRLLRFFYHSLRVKHNNGKIPNLSESQEQCKKLQNPVFASRKKICVKKCAYQKVYVRSDRTQQKFCQKLQKNELLHFLQHSIFPDLVNNKVFNCLFQHKWTLHSKFQTKRRFTFFQITSFCRKRDLSKYH